jgi:hypothetical protein
MKYTMRDAFGEQMKSLKSEIDQYDNVHGCRDSDLGIEPRCEYSDINDGQLDDCWTCRAYMRQSALEAGIPLSVVEGKTKLSDHFSERYINEQCNPRDCIDAVHTFEVH